VPAYNAAETIARCVSSLRALNPSALEIIVVDDGSTDETAKEAEAAGARVMRLPRNSGPGLARNAGAEIAKGEYLAFTDADCVVPSYWLARYLPLMNDSRYCAGTGPYIGTTIDEIMPQLMDLCLRYSQSAMPEAIESSISSNLFVKRSDFFSVGGFPEYSLPYATKACFTNEDEEFAYLLSRRTRKPVRWIRDNGPLHAYRPDLLSYFNQQAKYAESVLVSYARFPSMALGRANYSKSGAMTRVFSVWLGILSLLVLRDRLALFALAPFALIHLKLLSYVIGAEKRRRRRFHLALACYPFLFWTGLAWSKGLAVGSLKAIVGYVYWRLFNAKSAIPSSR
jgi:glycosyltransferase involved in cell wall biosynthesis